MPKAPPLRYMTREEAARARGAWAWMWILFALMVVADVILVGGAVMGWRELIRRMSEGEIVVGTLMLIGALVLTEWMRRSLLDRRKAQVDTPVYLFRGRFSKDFETGGYSIGDLRVEFIDGMLRMLVKEGDLCTAEVAKTTPPLVLRIVEVKRAGRPEQ